MIVGLVGPTAVGKTSVSISLATALDAEIVSVDSRQIYREISIGTAKPTAEELATVPHHFIDERSIADPITAAEYAELARSRIGEIEKRGNRTLLVGGSTLYLHALLFGMDDVPPGDPEVRKVLQARLEQEGLAVLTEELSWIDPATHTRIDLANPRRVLRALEVFHSTGRPLSDFQTAPDESPPALLPAKIFVLSRERSDLYRRINGRTETMIQDGLIDEIKVILEKGFDPLLQALQTIGYKEAIQFLAATIDFDRMVELIQRNTRRYAKRQLTWFRRYEGFEWIDVGEAESAQSVAARILDMISEDASPD
jgi:tRNA dimethylallyltransferase